MSAGRRRPVRSPPTGRSAGAAIPQELTSRQRSLLKARAHALEPVVQIGAAGASESAIAEVDRSLTWHGLIKVRLAGADREAREALTETLCARTGAVAVQNVGRVLVLWRPPRTTSRSRGETPRRARTRHGAGTHAPADACRRQRTHTGIRGVAITAAWSIRLTVFQLPRRTGTAAQVLSHSPASRSSVPARARLSVSNRG